ncbi:MAG: FAD-dependent oxidoreductase [Salinivirgaceae bacterium]|jgi:ferredoxin-NADP reductase|nr:FAD-dependent oxidoreductase [Salinivirgaceae bacterium]
MAIVKKYKSQIEKITAHGEGVYTLELKSLDRVFKYTPGQFLHIALDTDYDGAGQWPESRCFSMQSNPDEENIKITYALKGDFTKEMESSLKVGSEVWLKMPYGDLFDQEHVKQGTVFIAGGTGVTPYLSLFNDTRFAEYVRPILYLGLRNENYNFYKKELALAHEINSKLKVNIVNQETDGILNIEAILSESDSTSSFFISGPPAMIKNFKNYLIVNGVDESRVLTDDWE